MAKSRFIALVVVLAGIALGYFVYASETTDVTAPVSAPFKLGLDLSGGTHLVYRADTSKLDSKDVADALASLRDVIERRVNLFGVSEPLVQAEKGSGEDRLIVELPGVTDISKAVALIGATPLLEFRLEQSIIDHAQITNTLTKYGNESANGGVTKETAAELESELASTGLTGRLLKRAQLVFDPTTHLPVIQIAFNEEGTKLFSDITGNNIGKFLAIYLDGAPISIPVIRDRITNGEAVISGSFTPVEARTLVGRLNSGALPVPIELVSTQKVGATLGTQALDQGVKAGLVGFLLVALFLIFWYRLPGLLAVIALSLYIVLTLALFKFIPVTLTAAGIAGFILSIGMAVDANILIFERMKEELEKGEGLSVAMHEGFARAWPSIRDSNISSMITAVILFWMGTSLVKGFALTFALGVIVSMFTAITVTRNFLYALGTEGTLGSESAFKRFLYSSGFGKSSSTK